MSHTRFSYKEDITNDTSEREQWLRVCAEGWPIGGAGPSSGGHHLCDLHGVTQALSGLSSLSY